MIASGGMFGPTQKVILQCLELNIPAVKDNMKGIEMDMRDGNFPLLQQIIFSTDDAAAFKGAHWAVLLGAYPRQEGITRKDAMEKNVLIFRTMGRAIEQYASKGCKVLVVGNPANTNALICAQYAPQLHKDQFFSLARLDQNRASGQIAKRTGAAANEVRNVIIWGSHGQTPDLDQCTVRGRPLSEALDKEEDKKWLQTEFPKDLQQRGASIHKARKASAAMSTARSIVDHVRSLHIGTKVGEFVSMGIWSDGNEYGIENGLVYSMPVVCLGRGRVRVAPGLKLSATTKDTIKEAQLELIADRNLALEVFSKHAPAV